MASALQSIRRERSQGFKQAKSRAFVGSDKIKWDGLTTSFEVFSNDLEGTLSRIGMAYMMKEDVHKIYKQKGREMVEDEDFQEEHGIHPKQFDYDNAYLFGLLQSATKTITSAHIVDNKDKQDGLKAWIGLKKENQFNRSEAIKSEELESKIYAAYDPKEHLDFASYISSWRSWVSQMNAIGRTHMSASDQKRWLLKNLMADKDLIHLIMECEKKEEWDCDECAGHIIEQGLRHKRALDKAES